MINIKKEKKNQQQQPPHFPFSPFSGTQEVIDLFFSTKI